MPQTLTLTQTNQAAILKQLFQAPATPPTNPVAAAYAAASVTATAISAILALRNANVAAALTAWMPIVTSSTEAMLAGSALATIGQERAFLENAGVEFASQFQNISNWFATWNNWPTASEIPPIPTFTPDLLSLISQQVPVLPLP